MLSEMTLDDTNGALPISVLATPPRGVPVVKHSLFASLEVRAEVMRGEGRSLAALARLMPAGRGTGRASASTLWRWATSGIRLPSGQKLRLEACQLGGRLLSSEGSLRRFLDAQNGVAAPPSSPTVQPTPPAASRRRQAELAEVERELERHGL